MNPLNMTGPDFLALYAVLLAVGFIGAFFLRWYLRLPTGEPMQEINDLTAYEMAYLAGGAERVADAAIAQLIHRGALVLDAANRKLTRTEASPAKLTAIEQHVYDSVPAEGAAAIRAVQAAGRDATQGTRHRLEGLGLVVDSWQGFIARSVPFFVILCVFGLGLAKFFVGLSRNRPVVFLFFMAVPAVVLGSAIFLRPVLRSRLGDRALRMLTYRNAAMQHVFDRGDADVASGDLLLAMGLFGAGVLAGGPLADLQTALIPPRTSGSSSGCGGSSCGGGGGCGGGGCGGGCGGGGCGGCGS